MANWYIWSTFSFIFTNRICERSFASMEYNWTINDREAYFIPVKSREMFRLFLDSSSLYSSLAIERVLKWVVLNVSFSNIIACVCLLKIFTFSHGSLTCRVINVPWIDKIPKPTDSQKSFERLLFQLRSLMTASELIQTLKAHMHLAQLTS